jgi:3-oxoacyl-[acyl-carrier-protein] synthase-3
MPYSQILSTGSYVPERVVTNAEVDALIGEATSDWLIAHVGIRERRWMAPDQTTSDLVVEAARRALAKAGLEPADLDLIIVSTDTPDYLSPATSAVVQHKLGASRAGFYDVNSACAGWILAADQGARYLLTEPGAKYVLVAGGYSISRYLDFKDKKTANIFADGAGAAILGRGDAPGWLGTSLLSMGSFHDTLGIYAKNPETFGSPRLEFVRPFPRTFSTEYWPKLMRGILNKASLSFDAVDHYYFTQINLRIIEEVMETIGQPLSKTHWIMDKWGYTGSPSMVIALDDAIAQGRGPLPGETILFCGSGGGITMAASVWKWTV